jgi:serine/threonine protein kinase
LIALFYLKNLVAPPSARASKKSLRLYSFVALVYSIVGIVYNVFSLQTKYTPAKICLLVAGSISALLPFLTYYILLEDTSYWCRRKNNGALKGVNGQFQFLFLEKQQEVLVAIQDAITANASHHIDFCLLQIEEKLGSGGSAYVANGRMRLDKKSSFDQGLHVAIKVFTPITMNVCQIDKWSHEIHLSCSLHHPNILHFHGMAISPPFVCLVMDKSETDLRHYIDQFGHQDDIFSFGAKIQFMLDIAEAVRYLHERGFLHCDIKPENLLVFSDYHYHVARPEDKWQPKYLALSDFGEALDAHVDGIYSIKVFENPIRGTDGYAAPEIFRHEGYHAAIDVFSMTMTFWDICHPRSYARKFSTDADTQFHAKSSLREKIALGYRPPVDPVLEEYCSPLKELFQRGWAQDMSMRPTARELVCDLKYIRSHYTAWTAAIERSRMGLHEEVHSYDYPYASSPHAVSLYARENATKPTSNDFYSLLSSNRGSKMPVTSLGSYDAL